MGGDSTREPRWSSWRLSATIVGLGAWAAGPVVARALGLQGWWFLAGLLIVWAGIIALGTWWLVPGRPPRSQRSRTSRSSRRPQRPAGRPG